VRRSIRRVIALEHDPDVSPSWPESGGDLSRGKVRDFNVGREILNVASTLSRSDNGLTRGNLAGQRLHPVECPSRRRVT